MRTKISLIFSLLCLPLAFWACGDDGSSANGDSVAEDSDIMAKTFDDLPVCSGKREGVVAYVKDEKTAYICEEGKWIADEDDSDDDESGKSCSSSKSKLSSSGKSEGSSSSTTKDDPKSNNITVDTQGWVEGSDGDIKKGDSTDVKYKYDEAQDKWVAANTNDVELNLMGCTTNRTGEIGKSGETYYVCKNSNWQVAAEIDYDTYGEKCTSAEVGKTMNGKETETNKYYCSANGWLSLMGGWSWDVPKEVRLNPEIEYGEMTDTRDGQVYKTVVIGEGANAQTWMAENLNFNYNKGTAKSYCYGDEEANCEVTGLLYTWAAAIDSAALAEDADNPQTCGYGKTCELTEPVQGVCPSGWHLPSYAEWQALFTAVGGISEAGKALKSSSGWCSGGNGTDAYGFTALPAGFRDIGNFYSAGCNALFWSASELDSYGAYRMSLGYGSDNALLRNRDKYYGFSVRCLQN